MKNVTNTYSCMYHISLSIFALCTFLVATSPICAMSNEYETLTPASAQVEGAKLIHSFQKGGPEWGWNKKLKGLATFANNGDLLVSPGWLDEEGYENPQKPHWEGQNIDPDYSNFVRTQENELREQANQYRRSARENQNPYLGDACIYRYAINRGGNLTTLVPTRLGAISPEESARLNQSCNSRLMHGKASKILASAATSLRIQSGVIVPTLGRCERIATFFAPYFRSLPKADSIMGLPYWIHSLSNRDSNVTYADKLGYETTEPAALKDERSPDDTDASTLLAYSQSKKCAKTNSIIKCCTILDLYKSAFKPAKIKFGADTYIMGLKFSSHDPQKPSRLAILAHSCSENDLHTTHVHITDISHHDKPITTNHSERFLNKTDIGKILVCQDTGNINVRMEWSHDGKHLIIVKQDLLDGGPYEVTTYNPETGRAVATCIIENTDEPHGDTPFTPCHWGALSLSPDYSTLIIDSKVYELPQSFIQAHMENTAIDSSEQSLLWAIGADTDPHQTSQKYTYMRDSMSGENVDDSLSAMPQQMGQRPTSQATSLWSHLKRSWTTKQELDDSSDDDLEQPFKRLKL